MLHDVRTSPFRTLYSASSPSSALRLQLCGVQSRPLESQKMKETIKCRSLGITLRHYICFSQKWSRCETSNFVSRLIDLKHNRNDVNPTASQLFVTMRHSPCRPEILQIGCTHAIVTKHLPRRPHDTRQMKCHFAIHTQWPTRKSAEEHRTAI